LRFDVVQKPTYKVYHSETLSRDVEHTLARILHREVQMYDSIEKLKEGLLNEQTFDLYEVFQSIDTKHTDYIDFESLNNFLRKNGAIFQEADIASFIHIADKDMDCKLSYKEFVDGILPRLYKTKPSYAEDTEASMLKFSKEGTDISPCKRLNSVYYSPFTSPQRKSIDSINQFSQYSKHRYRASLDFLTKGFSPLILPKLMQSNEFKYKGNPDIPMLMSYQAEKEIILEKLRQDVAIKRDITLEALSQIFDTENKGYINTFDIMKGFKHFGINPESDKLYLVINRSDRERNGRLYKKDLFELFIPYQQEYAAILTSKSEALKRKGNISNDSCKLIKKLLQTYLDVEAEYKNWRVGISGGKLRETFESIIKPGKHYFDLADVFM